MKNEKLIDFEERMNGERTSTGINKENARKMIDEIANYPIDSLTKNTNDITIQSPRTYEKLIGFIELRREYEQVYCKSNQQNFKEFFQGMRILVDSIEDIFIQYQSSELR